MDFCQFLCGLTVMIILSSKGCHSQLPTCGLAFSNTNTRIVGGQNAKPGNWPWQVSLNDDKGVFCSGSLISSRWVLTAAHCIARIDFRKVTAYLGRNSQSGSNPNEVQKKIVKAVIHPSYQSLTNDNDICLLMLAGTVKNNDHIFPVCLASATSTFHTGTSSWVAGWGSTGEASSSNILQEVNLPIVGNNECKCAHRGLTDNMICAGLKKGGKDACRGDSGAPLVSKNGFSWVQSGVVSFGEGCAEPMSPGGYARVSRYQGWITNVTGQNTPGFVTFKSSGVDSDTNFVCPSIETNKADNITTAATTTTKAVVTKTTQGQGNTVNVTSSDGDSIFDSGENVIHFSHFTHFISLCVLVLSLCALVGNA